MFFDRIRNSYVLKKKNSRSSKIIISNVNLLFCVLLNVIVKEDLFNNRCCKHDKVCNIKKHLHFKISHRAAKKLTH